MRGKHVVAVMLALLAALALALPASAKGGKGTAFKEKTAHAAFRSVDENGACTFVFVGATDGTSPFREPGLEGARSSAHVSIAKFTSCPPDEPTEGPVEGVEPSAVFMGAVKLAAEDFVMDKKLGSATLDAEVPVQAMPLCEPDAACAQEVVQEERTISVNLDWAGTGKLRRVNERFDGYRAKGLSRSGEARGSVYTSAVGLLDVVEEHVTPDGVSEYAEMYSIAGRFKMKHRPPMEPGLPMQDIPR